MYLVLVVSFFVLVFGGSPRLSGVFMSVFVVRCVWVFFWVFHLYM